MASVLISLKENYEDWRIGKNPEVDKWLLMDAPGGVILIMLAYLVFVLKIGPALMKNRSPMELRNSMVLYNGIQVLFSIFLVWKSLRVDIPFRAMFSSDCIQRVTQPSRNKAVLLNGAWWYFFAKVTELLDTVFFVLRKRTRQISFLHVYHHSATLLFSWAYLKYAPGEQGAIIGLLNSMVHVMMYSYYMISAMGPAYQKYLWWKKYMTVIQMIQFCMMISFMTLTAFSNCGYSRTVSYFFIINSISFLYLFSDFYRQSYKRTPRKTAESNGIHKLNNNTANGHYYDAQAYSQINKDVQILNSSEKLNKTE